MGSLMLYIGVFSVASVLMCPKDKRFLFFNILGIAMLIIFAGGRYFVGTDFLTYWRIFHRQSNYTWSKFFEAVNDDYLFHIINKITYGLGGRTWTWSVIAALIVIPIYVTLRKQYPKISLGASVFAFLFLSFAGSFNVSRQYIAVAIIFWSLKYVFENKFFKFALCVIIAALFHKSAVLCIILWIFWSHKENKPVTGDHRVFLIIFSTIAVWLYQPIISLVSSSVSYLESYESYANDKAGGMNRDFFLDVLILILVLIATKYLENMDEEDSRYQYFITLLIVAVLIGTTGFNHPQVKRIAYFFSVPAELVLFGYIPKKVPEQSRSLTFVILCVYILFRFILTAYILGQGHLIPYEFRWN